MTAAWPRRRTKTQFRAVVRSNSMETTIHSYGYPEPNTVWHVQPMRLLAWYRPLLYFRVFVTTRAAEFRTRRSLSVTAFDDLYSRLQQRSTRLEQRRARVWPLIRHLTTFVYTSYLPKPFVSSSTSFWYEFFHIRLTYSFTRHFFLFWFTTLYIHNSLSFSLPATSFTNPTHVLPPVELLPPGLPPRTISHTVSSELLGVCFYFFLILCFCAVR